MDITVVARNAEIHPNFREYVEEKVSKITQFYPRAQRVDVEPDSPNVPRQADTAERIELTVYGKARSSALRLSPLIATRPSTSPPASSTSACAACVIA